jgi:hypothetical protein
MDKANEVLDCAAVIGGLDLTKVYSEDEFDEACVCASVQCAGDPRALISFSHTYPVEPAVAVGGSLRALVIRMGFSILASSLMDGLPNNKALALFKFALGGGHLSATRDAAGSVFFRVLRCVHAVSLSRGAIYQTMAALVVGTESDAGSVVADSWRMIVAASVCLQLHQPIDLLLQEIACAAELAGAGTRELRRAAFIKIFHRPLAVTEFLKLLLTNTALPLDTYGQFQMFEALHTQGQDVASLSAVKLMDRKLAPLSAMISQWSLLPAIADRVEKARSYFHREGAAVPVPSATFGANSQSDLSGPSAARAVRLAGFVALLPKLKALAAMRFPPLMRSFDVMLDPAVKPAYLFANSMLTKLDTAEDLAGLSPLLSQRDKYFGMSMATEKGGVIPEELQNYRVPADFVKAFDSGFWSNIPVENTVLEITSLGEEVQVVKIAEDQWYKSYSRMVRIREVFGAFFVALKFDMTGDHSFFSFCDSLIALLHRAELMPGSPAAVAILSFVPGIWKLGMDEAGEKFIGQCGTSSASGKKIPVAFDLPLDLTFLPPTASVWRDLGIHEENVSMAKKLRKTFGAGINALLSQRPTGGLHCLSLALPKPLALSV